MKAFPTATGAVGMDLRDYFAAKALQGLLAADPGTDADSLVEILAAASYQLADAMMRQRERK